MSVGEEGGGSWSEEGEEVGRNQKMVVVEEEVEVEVEHPSPCPSRREWFNLTPCVTRGGNVASLSFSP